MTLQTTSKRERPPGLRRPSRGRGIVRYQALLEATEALLQDSTPDVIGLYQIAEKAGVPPASVYHFFPTKEAAYQALAEQYLQGLVKLHGQPIEARRIRTWVDLLAFDMRRAMDYFNQRPPMLKILYGGYGGVEARNLDIVVTDALANASYERLNRIFHVPFLQDQRKKAQIGLAILDAIWTISFRLHGTITEDYYEESVKACAAYRRLFLPEYLEPREVLTEAAARDGTVTLPYDFEDFSAPPA
jgi:AcrR family transcriptional regulator